MERTEIARKSKGEEKGGEERRMFAVDRTRTREQVGARGGCRWWRMHRAGSEKNAAVGYRCWAAAGPGAGRGQLFLSDVDSSRRETR